MGSNAVLCAVMTGGRRRVPRPDDRVNHRLDEKVEEPHAYLAVDTGSERRWAG